MLSLSLILVLARGAAPVTDDGPVALRVTTAEVTERIPLPNLRAPIEITVDPMAAGFELRAGKQAAALARWVVDHAGAICPKAAVSGSVVEVRCRTRRLDAFISTEGKKTYLDIYELRGLPWRDGPSGPPFFHYDPVRSGIGAACPGSTPAGRGECALLDGHQLEAAMQFRAAIDAGPSQLSMLRLGDLSLSSGDPTTAMGWYRRAGLYGVFGRMARTRVCEMEGTCLASTALVERLFDPAGLPEPLRAEMRIRAIRAEALNGRLESAIRMMVTQIQAEGAGSICREGGEPICRRVLLEFMRQAAAADPVGPGAASAQDEPSIEEQALTMYLSLPRWDQGYLVPELAGAAANLAGHLGAPIFGGSILSAVAPRVPPPMLPEHLLRAAELFLEGDDVARTRLVIEYARTRIGKRTSPRWIAVEKKLLALASAEDQERQEPIPTGITVDTAEISRELSAAQAVLARARLIAAEKNPRPQGEK